MKSVTVRSWSIFSVTVGIGFAVVVHVCHVGDAWADTKKRTGAAGAGGSWYERLTGGLFGGPKPKTSPPSANTEGSINLARFVSQIQNEVMLTTDQRMGLISFVSYYSEIDLQLNPSLNFNHRPSSQAHNLHQEIFTIERALRPNIKREEVEKLLTIMFSSRGNPGEGFTNELGPQLVGLPLHSWHVEGFNTATMMDGVSYPQARQKIHDKNKLTGFFELSKNDAQPIGRRNYFFQNRPSEARAASIQVKGGFGGQAVRDYGSLGVRS